MMATCALVTLSFLLVVSGEAATDYDYDNQHKWGGSCNTGSNQSPLDFQTVYTSSFPPFIFDNYGLINITLEVNGHSLKANLVPLSPNLPHLLGGGLSDEYVLDSFHFHWGRNNGEGSEHRLLSCSFAGEMHFVHYKKKYGNVGEAKEHPDGVAVLAVWLVAAVDDYESKQQLYGYDHDEPTNFWLDFLVPYGPFVNHSPRQTILRNLLPQNTDSFYRYEGSLTTPPCSETVVWTVFRDPVVAPRRLWRLLRTLRSPPGHGIPIGRNFRNIQAQGARKVYFSYDPASHLIQCNNREVEELEK